MVRCEGCRQVQLALARDGKLVVFLRADGTVAAVGRPKGVKR
jgi:hypothetical protein